jgi:hypothetical protein
MAVETTGENLIFLISQPRSGSTLLQKILGSHDEISTSVEPWLLLPLVYVLNSKLNRNEHYNPFGHINVTEFLESVPEGRSLYLEGISTLMSKIYNAALEPGKAMFLDKTPRYYLIIPILAEMFPRARFILLFRNPLAVLASMHKAWSGGMGLYNASLRRDLTDAPRLLIEAKKSLGDRAFSICYETMTDNTDKELRSLCDWLCIPYQENMLEYGKQNKKRWKLGDQTSVYDHDRPVTLSHDKWTEFVHSAQNWKYADNYLDYLGPTIVQELGYSFSELREKLDSNRPSVFFRIFTPPLFFSMSLHNIFRKIYRKMVYGEAVF